MGARVSAVFPGDDSRRTGGPGPGPYAADAYGPPGDDQTDAAQDLRGAFGAALSTGRQWIAEWLELLAIETRLGLRTVLALAICAACTALAAISAWLALVAAVCALVVWAGAPWPVALFGAALLNLAAAIVLWLQIRRLLGRLGFAASRAGAGLAPVPTGAPHRAAPGRPSGAATDTASAMAPRRPTAEPGGASGGSSRAA